VLHGVIILLYSFQHYRPRQRLSTSTNSRNKVSSSPSLKAQLITAAKAWSRRQKPAENREKRRQVLKSASVEKADSQPATTAAAAAAAAAPTVGAGSFPVVLASLDDVVIVVALALAVVAAFIVLDDWRRDLFPTDGRGREEVDVDEAAAAAEELLWTPTPLLLLQLPSPLLSQAVSTRIVRQHQNHRKRKPSAVSTAELLGQLSSSSVGICRRH